MLIQLMIRLVVDQSRLVWPVCRLPMLTILSRGCSRFGSFAFDQLRLPVVAQAAVLGFGREQAGWARGPGGGPDVVLVTDVGQRALVGTSG